MEAVRRAASRREPAGTSVPVRVRIWTTREYICNRGWGFFLIEKTGTQSEGATAESEFLVELFLYQEAHT